MALFDRPSSAHLLSLLRIGFAARLRSEVADIFLSTGATRTLERTDSRPDASVFFFFSADPSTCSPSTRTPLPYHANTVILLLDKGPIEPRDQPPYYLSIPTTPSAAPLTSTTPGLLRLSLQRAPNPRRTLFAFSSPGPSPHYISLRGVRNGQPARICDTLSKYALFHLEIIPGSLGNHHICPPFPHTSPPLLPAQALTHALLQLGVPFCLTSAHAARFVTSLSGGCGFKLVPIRGEGNENENASADSKQDTLKFAAFMSALPVPDNDLASRYYTLVLASKRSIALKLAVGPESFEVLTCDLQKSRGQPAPSVRMFAHANNWGAISLGADDPPPAERDLESPNEEYRGRVVTHWLTATPDAKFNIRKHRRHWETFTVEFVSQATTAALAELPVPAVYTFAERETRSVVRADIARRVVALQTVRNAERGTHGESPHEGNRNVTDMPGFNHAAALTALSESPKVGKGNFSAKDTAGTGGAESTEQKGKNRKKKNGVSAKKGVAGGSSAASAASSLPRNAANRKASKKNRKKKRTAASSPSNVTSSNAASTKGNNITSRNLDKANLDENASSSVPATSSPSDSSEAKNAPLNAGPPCAACGRALSGTYTTAMGKSFHAHCFCCGYCRRPMGANKGKFRERNGIPYCDNCYAMHIASRCARCLQPITDRPNEPRCSRCVTGDENARVRQRGSRMVNFPGFGLNSSQNSVPPPGLLSGAPTLGNNSGSGERSNPHPPMLPTPSRR